MVKLMYYRAKCRKKILIVNKNRKIKLINKIILIFLAIGIFVILSFKFINKKVSPILMEYAESSVKKITNLIINKAISKHTAEQLNIDELFIITKDNNGIIKTIDFNPTLVNKTLTIITNNIQLNLKYLEEGKIDLLELPDNVEVEFDESKISKGIIYEIPTGVIFNNALLSNLGPKIPVKLSIIGDIVSTINTNITNYGINNALIEVNVVVEVEEMVILPISTKKIKVSTSIPVAIKLIQGTVPNYYFNGIEKNSPSISLPVT